MTKPSSLSAIAKAAAARAAGAKRERDVIDVRKPPASEPTPEQRQHADYVEQDIVDRTPKGPITIGKAFKRVARFETIEGLSAEQLRALRFYREAYDAAAISPTKSALDIRPRGGGAEGTMSRLEAIVAAGTTLRLVEQGMPGALLPILRAVAGLDQDFKALAIERFGGRSISRIHTTKHNARVISSIEPKSNRHRQLIRDEFLDAATRLVVVVAPFLATAEERRAAALAPAQTGTAQVAAAPPAPRTPLPAVDPAYLDEAGRMRPMAEIADIIRGLDNERE